MLAEPRGAWCPCFSSTVREQCTSDSSARTSFPAAWDLPGFNQKLPFPSVIAHIGGKHTPLCLVLFESRVSQSQHIDVMGKIKLFFSRRARSCFPHFKMCSSPLASTHSGSGSLPSHTWWRWSGIPPGITQCPPQDRTTRQASYNHCKTTEKVMLSHLHTVSLSEEKPAEPRWVRSQALTRRH